MNTEKKAGRKPISDKKKPVTIYVRESKIEELTLEKIKEYLNKSVEKL